MWVYVAAVLTALAFLVFLRVYQFKCAFFPLLDTGLREIASPTEELSEEESEARREALVQRLMEDMKPRRYVRVIDPILMAVAGIWCLVQIMRQIKREEPQGTCADCGRPLDDDCAHDE